MLLADLLPADRKLLTWRPASSGDGEDAVQDPPSGSLAVSAVSSDAASEGDLDAASDAESDAASSLGSDANEPLNGPPPTEAPVDAASGDASGSGDAVPVGALPRIDPASFEPSAVAETIERLSLPEPDAMRLLLLRWGIEADELPSDDPCAGVGSFGLQCERGLGGLSEIRRFDRPALLQVRGAEGVPRYIVLSALDASLGTLDVSSGSELAPVEGIESILTGDYILLWKLPLDGSTLIGFGAVGDVVVWLRRTLAQVPASGLPASDSRFYDLDLTRAVQAFQASRGLAADGIVGPHTVIQLHNAIDLPGIPRLNPPPETPEPASTEPAAS
jgi:general secretion pathway protein A